MLSFVIPSRENSAAIAELYRQISNQCDQIEEDFEVIFIDHGSRESTWSSMFELAEEYPNNVRAIKLHENTTKESAHLIGFHLAIGDVIFTMSASLKDDPVAIPHFLKELERGHDVVVGYKQFYKKKLSRFSPGKLLNKAVAVFSGIDLNHYNSNYICYRSEVIRSMTESSYGGLQKKLPLSADVDGYKVGQLLLKSKTKTAESLYNLLDLSTLNFLHHHPEKPQRFISSVSAGLFSMGLVLVFLGQAEWLHTQMLTFIGAGLIFNVIPLAVLSIVMDMQMTMLSKGQSIESLSNNLIVRDTKEKIELTGMNSQNQKTSKAKTKVSE